MHVIFDIANNYTFEVYKRRCIPVDETRVIANYARMTLFDVWIHAAKERKMQERNIQSTRESPPIMIFLTNVHF